MVSIPEYFMLVQTYANQLFIRKPFYELIKLDH